MGSTPCCRKQRFSNLRPLLWKSQAKPSDERFQYPAESDKDQIMLRLKNTVLNPLCLSNIGVIEGSFFFFLFCRQAMSFVQEKLITRTNIHIKL